MIKNNIEYISESDGFQISKTMDMKVVVPCDEFGDASAADVAVGKTFTSGNGLRLTGTLNNCNVHTAALVIPKGRMRGDVNYDGVVDEKDVKLIYQYISYTQSFDAESQEAADLDKSGGVTYNDANSIGSPYVKKYKVTTSSEDFIGPWRIRDEFIADPNQEYEWIFSAEVIVPEVTPNSTVKITPKHFTEVTKCGMSSYIELEEGKITFYTLRPPKEDVECLIEFFEDGYGPAVLVVMPNERELDENNVENILDGYTSGSLRTVGSKAEDSTYNIGQYSFAEGYETQSIGSYSHAEGSETKSSGDCAHSEGLRSYASGEAAHAEGCCTEANGYYSHAEGCRTIASSDNQHVHGKYNIEDTENKYIDIVGNGTASSNRSNAYTLDWDGNGTFSGKVTAGAAPTGEMDLVTKQYVDNAIAEVLARIGQ